MKTHKYAEYKLCLFCFSRNFPKIFRTAIIKEYLPMDVPYFFKEHLKMSASDEVTLKKKFWWALTLKTKWYYSCGCSDDSRSCEQLKKDITDKYFEKKV